MTKEEFARRLTNACDAVIQAEAELTEIDSKFGDADHGLTMTKVAKAIAQAVASGILRYFDLPLVPPQEPQGAYAALGSGVLRLRARPSVQARVLANIPNGGELTVVGTLEGWYVVQYGRLTGYAAAPYVKLRPGNIS